MEFTRTGRFVRQLNLDAAEGGAFGIDVASVGDLVRFAFVDDNAVDLTVLSLRNSPATMTIPESIKRAMKHNPEPLGWKLLEPVAFVDSRDHPAIQLADVVAGTTVALFTNGLPGCDAIVESISRHGHPHSILPDMDVIDPATRAAAVNALMVYDLAKRAERHGDPYENLEAMYHFAEVSWAKGDYELIKNGRNPAD